MKKFTCTLIIVLVSMFAFQGTRAQDQPLTDAQQSDVRLMQGMANDKSELAFTVLGDMVTDDYVYAFQQAAWDMAYFAVSKGANEDAYAYMLDRLYAETFDMMYQLKGARLALEFTPYLFTIDGDITAEWLWSHVDSTYRHEDTVMVVVSARSRDMQMAMDKVELEARSRFVPIVQQAQGLPEGSLVRIRRSFVAGQSIRRINNVYEAVVLMKVPLALNLEP